MKAKFILQNTSQNGSSFNRTPEFIVVAGPTASGKSDIAMALAQRFNGSIVCCDSVQLYRGFDIGSAKPSRSDREIIPHYLYDVFNWDETCDAATYASLAREAISHIRADERIPIVVGGTGLYLRALLGDAWDTDVPSDDDLRHELAKRSSSELFSELQSVDPLRASQLHPNDRFRVIRALEINKLTGQPVRIRTPNTSKFESHVMIFVCPERTTLHERIDARTTQMLESGFEAEVRGLLDAGIDPGSKTMQSIGYKQVTAMIQGELDRSHLKERITAATRQYAKRQVTWFKKVPADVTVEGIGDLPQIVLLLDTILKM